MRALPGRPGSPNDPAPGSGHIPPWSRRRCLRVAGGTLASAGIWASLCWPRSAGKERAALRSVSRRTHALGTEACLTALHPDPEVARGALDAAFRELETVEALMSLYREDSELRRLNRDGRLTHPHPYLCQVLDFARNLAERTEGAFDVTVQPLWELYRRRAREGRRPGAEELALARALVDWRGVRCDAEGAALPSGAAITLNGIAQGFAADRAAAILLHHGIRHALIETGELGALGLDSSGRPWKIGIQHPRAPAAYVALAELGGRSLATSGDYATTFTPDFTDHHLIHPGTGRSPQHYASVSVAAPTAMEADALSTALFMLEPEQAMALLASCSEVDALLVHKNGRVQATPGFPLAS